MQNVYGEHTLSSNTGGHRWGLIAGSIGAGALLMYLFDPDRGRGRRARLSDQLTSKANRIGRAAGSKARDLRNRAQGLMHEVGLAHPLETQDNTQAENDNQYRSIPQGA